MNFVGRSAQAAVCFLLISVLSADVVAQTRRNQQPVDRRTRVNLGLWGAMHDRHADQFAIWLDLSHDQETAMRAALDAYIRRFNSSTESLHERVEVAWRTYDQSHGEMQPHEAEAALNNVIAAVGAFQEAARAEDDRFFAEVRTLLSADQLPRWRRLPLRRHRVAGLGGGGRLHEAELDLMKMIRIETDRERREYSGNPPAFVTVSSDEFDTLVAAMDVYEPMLIVARENNKRAYRRVLPELLQATELGRRGMDRGLSQTEREQLQASRREVAEVWGRGHIHTSYELERLNRRGLELFMQHLPPAKAAELEHTYLVSAYPNIYEDPTALIDLLETTLNLSTLSKEQHDELVAIRDAYNAAYRSLSRKMAKTERDERNVMFTNPVDEWDQRFRLTIERSDLGFEREALATSTIERVLQTITTEQSAAVLRDLWVAETHRLHAHRADRRSRRRWEPQQVVTANLLRVLNASGLREDVFVAYERLIATEALDAGDTEIVLQLPDWQYADVEPVRYWHDEQRVEHARLLEAEAKAEIEPAPNAPIEK